MGNSTTRERIVQVADQLFYQQGFERTSFADIANGVGISRGNFYYHFRTKDEILDAVIEARLARTRSMLAHWANVGATPEARIGHFIDILIGNRDKIKHYGCPVGTLSTELAKLNHAAKAGANRLFTLFRTWLRRQFAQLGRKADADKLAMHLLARSQGIATLANAFQDECFIREEVKQLHAWLRACAENATQPA